MRAVVQRVSRASVTVEGRRTGAVETGLLALVAAGKEDGEADITWMVKKLCGLRIFPDEAGKMNRSVADIGGGLLLVSQFTLYGDARKGFRPGFSDAMPPDEARSYFECFVRAVRRTGLLVETGEFGADMDVSLVNDGPVTILLDSKKNF